MIKQHYFTNIVLKAGFNINLDSHQNFHIISKLINTQKTSVVENIHVSNIVKKMSSIYARIKKQNKFNNQTVFSARFGKQNEDNKLTDEFETFNKFSTNQNLTGTDTDKTDVRSQLQQPLLNQESEGSGWRFF